MSSQTAETEENESINSQSDTISTPARKRRATATPEVAHARQQMDEAVRVLKTISHSDTSEVDLFCKLLAAKIKKFNQDEREDIMHEIDELMYNKRRKESLKNMTSTPLSDISNSYGSTRRVSLQSPSPSASSQSQFHSISYEQTPSPYPLNMYDEEYHQVDRPTTQNTINIMSNDIIRQAFVTSGNTCTNLDGQL